MQYLLTYQQARGDRDDIGCSVFSRDVLTGLGNMAEDIPMDNSTQDEVNMADKNEC